MITFNNFLSTTAIEEAKVDNWITVNKLEFISIHESEWEHELYAKAWELFGNPETSVLERNLNVDDIVAWFGKHIHGADYKLAVKDLIELIKRKGIEKKGKHDIFYYASKVANSYRNVDGRELAKMYQNAVTESEAVANTTAGVAIPDSPFKVGKFAGHDVIEVDAETYCKCKFGKRPYAKWDGYIEDETLRTFVQKRYNAKKSLIVSNKDSGAMTYLKKN